MVSAPILTHATRAQPIPAIVDLIASKQPEKVLMTIAARVDSTEGARTVNFRQFARAVDRTAAWLDSKLGKANDQPAFGFVSANYDFRYIIFTIASIKSGHKIFLPSPRNSEEFHTHLIKKIGIKTFVSSIKLGPYIEKNDCNVIQAPAIEDLLADEGDVSAYPYTKTLAEAVDDKIIIMHSSGSTGPPKPITWTNGYLEASQQALFLPMTSKGLMLHGFGEQKPLTLQMPLFHTAGMLCVLCSAIYMETPVIIAPPSAIVNSTNVVSFIKAFKPTNGLIPPSVLEDLSKDEDSMKAIESMDNVCFGGAPLAEDAGERLNKHTKVMSFIGSTEAGLYPVIMPENDDVPAYSYMRMEPLPGLAMRPQEDGLFELVFEKTDKYNWTVFHTFPDKSEYATSDLYERHPTDPLSWKMVGRKDDVLVLSNGEKVVPAPMEDYLRMAPEVTGALYFGHGKFTVGALIELDERLTANISTDELVKRVRPYALHANEIAPAFARLTKDMVIFTDKERPMKRAPKGSIVRRTTLAEYAEEIEQLYLKADEGTAEPLVKNMTEAETLKGLSSIFEYLLEKQIGEQEDFFQSAGVDSMQVISATRTIKASVMADAPEYASKVQATLIYSNPTLQQLTKAVRSLVLTGNPAGSRDIGREIQAMLGKYAEGIPKAVERASSGSEKINVVLTGSTGSLGSYFLSLLINNPSVEKVFALNRGDDSKARQQESIEYRGLASDLRKVTFLKASLGNKNLGLSPQEYRELVDSTNLIIHNAWPVNFNQSLESFEPHVRGVRNFIDLAAASPRRPQIVFLSTVGTTNNWDAFYPDSPRPETIIDDSRPAQGGGYGEGKWVSEHLLAAAAEQGVNATIARVGQVAGPVESAKGMWNKQEWLPTIIHSSAYMGKLPNSLGAAPMSWIPVDSMAKIIVELGLHDLQQTEPASKTGLTTVYNLTNPNEKPWSNLISTIRERLPQVKETVSWPEWVAQVRTDNDAGTHDAAKHPAIKLLDFYEAMDQGKESIGFSTDKAQATSKTMAAVPPVNTEWMGLWLSQWGF